MNYDEFKEFAYAAGLRDKGEPQAASTRRKNMHVIDLKALFAEINEEEQATSKAKQLENDVNDDDAFLRFEFLECVMRLAGQVPSEDPKTSLPGYDSPGPANPFAKTFCGAL
jgi:hypothetical protein